MRILLLAALLLILNLVNAQGIQCQGATISAIGKGIVYGTPNMARFSVEISTTSNTSLQAAQTTNNKMAQVLQILSRNNIPSANIQTQSLSISPQYNYSANVYPSPIIGQTASTSVSVRVRNISADGSSVGTLYDQLSNIDGVSIDGLSFDIENKTLLRSQARAQAYQSAKDTASQFANFGGYRLGQPQLINEQSTETRVNFGRIAYDNVAAM